MNRSLEGAVRFRLTRKKRATYKRLVEELWKFLKETQPLKKDFEKASFDKGNISLTSKDYALHVSAQPELHIWFGLKNIQRSLTMPIISNYEQTIFGFLVTFGGRELSQYEANGSYLADSPQEIPSRAEGMVDTAKLVRASGKLRTTVKPVGQILSLEWKGANWLVVLALLGKSRLFALFYSIRHKGKIDTMFITKRLQDSVELGKKIKTAMDSL